MSALTGPKIEELVRAGELVIDPFDPAQVNPNSYDLCLGDALVTYQFRGYLDPKVAAPTQTLSIPPAGLVLMPGTLYLGSTVERIGSDSFVAFVEGKSSLGRLGLTAHVTAGFIDCGFHGNVTLEMTVVHPLKVYAGMRVCQICFVETVGEIRRYGGKYQNQQGPQPSRSWQDFAQKDRPPAAARPDT